ncbi:MAG: glycosyltransferase family 39 protein, partial [Planctomycetota bacterium]
MKKNHLLSFLLPLAIMGVAFFFRYYPHNYCAPGCVLLRHDELNYLNRVLGFLNGSWDVHYFINPTLYAYLLYAATAASGLWATLSGRFASFSDFALSVTFDPYPILVAGRFVTLVAGTATVGLVYAVSRRLFSPWVAVVASLALALDVTHARRGVLTGNECVTALLCVLLFACLLHYLRRPGAGRHALCGFVLGLAGAVKYNAFIFVLPLMAASCMAALREEDLRAQPPWSRFRLCAVRSLVRPKFMAAYLFLVVGFFAGSPCILLNFNDFASEFFRQYSYLQDGFSDFDRVADHLGYLYYLTNFSAMNSGHAVSALCGAGLVVMGIAAIRKQDFRYILLVSAALPLYLFLGKGTFSRMRFLLPAIPFILISGAWFFTTIMEFLTGLSRKRDLSHAGRIKRHAIIAVVAAAVLIPGAVQVRAVMEEVYAHDQRHEIMLWIKENLEPEDNTLEFVHSSFYQVPG